MVDTKGDARKDRPYMVDTKGNTETNKNTTNTKQYEDISIELREQ